MDNRSQLGKLFVISAPSGTGKSSIITALRRAMPDLNYSISLTTRTARLDEKDGIDYRFVTYKYFMRQIAIGELLEYTKIFGNYYGTSVSVVMEALTFGIDLLLEIDVVGSVKIKERFPQAILIFILPPSRIELERRLRGRFSENEINIRLRLEMVYKELSYLSYFNHLIINDYIKLAVNEIKTIIFTERALINKSLSNIFFKYS